MGKRWIIWLIALLALGLCFSPAPALAEGSPPGDGGITVWGEDYTLEEGERLDGDLVVFDGDATLEPGSRVAGSVIVWNGSAEVQGVIKGELVVSGGDIYLGDSAQVSGNVVCSLDCDLDREDGAQVDGNIVEGIPLGEFPFDRWHGIPVPVPPSPPNFSISGAGRALSWAFKVIRGVASVLVVSAVAGLVALIWPQQVKLVGQAVVESPGASFGIGLLTVFAAVTLAIALLVTICFSPIAVLLVLALGVTGLFGWIGVGALVGERLMQSFNARTAAPLWAAGTGTLVITLVIAGLDVLPCLGVLGMFLTCVLGCLGLGAVALTRFGTMAHTPTPPVEAPAPSDADT